MSAVLYQQQLFYSERDARWAVFFQAVGIPWKYIPPQEDLPLPPVFWLEEQQAWIFTTETNDWLEGKQPPDEAFAPAALLIKGTEKQVFVFAGEEMRPHTQDQRPTVAFRFGPEPDYSPDQENGYYWVECPFCRKLALQRAGGVTGDYCEHMQRLFKVLTTDLQSQPGVQGSTAEDAHHQWWLSKVSEPDDYGRFAAH